MIQRKEENDKTEREHRKEGNWEAKMRKTKPEKKLK